MAKNTPANAGDLGSIPGSKDPLEEEVATYSNILAWTISMDRGAWCATYIPGLPRVRQDGATNTQGLKST